MSVIWSGFHPNVSAGFLAALSPVWILSVLLELAILFRGIRAKILAVYPFFFASMVCSLLGDLLMFAVLLQAPRLYLPFYWGVQLVTLFAACGIVLEIFKHVLSGYPGADRFARIVSVAVFVAVCCFCLVYPSLVQQPTVATSVIGFERDIRTVQAVFLWGVILVIMRYGIHVGKNVMGMIGGYGLYIFVSLLSLAVRAYAGPSFDLAWRFVQPISYTACLLIWTYSLWRYAPGPAPDPHLRIESDYEALAARTRGALVTMRSYFTRSIRS